MIKYFGIILCLILFKGMAAQAPHLDAVGKWNQEGLREIDKEIFNDVWGWADGKGKEYAIMGSLDSIYFIDVTDAANPILVDVEAGADSMVIHRDFKTYKHYCYAVGDEGASTLQIFDLSYLPDSVHKVYDNDTFSRRTHNIFIDGKRLYLATCNSNLGYTALRILNLENPEKPSFYYDIEVVGVQIYEIHDVYARNDTAFCSAGDEGIFVYLVSDSAEANGKKVYSPNMQLIGGKVLYPDKGYNHSSALHRDGKHLYFADEDFGLNLKVLQNKQGIGWSVVKQFGLNANKGSIAHNPFVLGDLLYVAYYHEGVQVFDISEPANPIRIGGYDTYPENTDYKGMYGCWGVYPYLPSGNILASDQMNGLFVFDLNVSILKPSQAENFVIYPNVIFGTDLIQIENKGSRTVFAKVRIVTSSGALIYSQEQNMFAKHKHIIQLDEQISKPGLYVIYIQSEGSQMAKRLIIL